MRKVNILLHKGKGIISSLIRWQTRGAYSHASIQPDGQSIYESWQGGIRPGVRNVEIKDYSNIDIFIIYLTDEQHDKLVNFLDKQLDKRYDYFGVLRFVSRRAARDDDKWFCSELVFAALAFAGIELFKETHAWEVSPQMLSRSPLLKRVTEEVTEQKKGTTEKKTLDAGHPEGVLIGPEVNWTDK